MTIPVSCGRGLSSLKITSSFLSIKNSTPNIPEEIINRIEQSTDESLEGIKICIELIDKYKSIEGVSGIHLMGYKQEKEIASVISNFK